MSPALSSVRNPAHADLFGDIDDEQVLRRFTDFVAKTEAFERLAKDIAMHISFSDPAYTTRDQVPQDVIDEESAIYAKQAKDSGKPEQVIEKIVAGKLEAFYKERVLLDQEWIQDKSKTIAALLDEAKASMGENVSIGRFARIRVGEECRELECARPPWLTPPSSSGRF